MTNITSELRRVFIVHACLEILLYLVDAKPTTVVERTLSESFHNPPSVDADRIIERTRNLFCIPILRIFTVDLQKPLRPEESVGLTGDHPKLGVWQVDSSLKMTTRDTNRMRWSLHMPICTSGRIHFRYFLYHIDERGNRRIREWESQQHARMLERYEMYNKEVDRFGQIATMSMGDVEKERGWLRYENVIELKFIWEQHIKWNRNVNLKKNQKYLLKLNAQRGVSSANSLRDTDLEVSRYDYNSSEFRLQPERGVDYGAGDIVIFHITTPLRSRNTYRLTIYTIDGYEIGEVTILPMDLQPSEGELDLPIYSAADGFQAGRLTLPYLFIKPLSNSAQLNFRGSFHHYWPPNWPTVDVGHRGAGVSFGDNEAKYLENTIKSFLYIHQLHGDMIKLNVQMTKDHILVVWYDFGFNTAAVGVQVESDADLEYVFVEDLTYNQLKKCRVFVTEGPDDQIREISNLNVRATSVKSRIFPKLSEIYEALPKTLGIDVEIKWPQLLQRGEWETESPPSLDKNRFVDAILQTTGQYGCGRPLIFSSFDADVCSMIRHKQNVFPVMFLTIGETTMWEPYMDLRARSFLNAVNFAQSENILGTAPHAEDFIDNPGLVNLGLNLAQVVFVWGNDLNDAQVIEQFKRLDVTGVVYNQMEINGPNERKSFFDASELTEIFARQCFAVGNLSWKDNLEPSHSGFFFNNIRKDDM